MVMQAILLTALVIEIAVYVWLGGSLVNRGYSWLVIAPLIGSLVVLLRMSYAIPSFIVALILRRRDRREIPWGNALFALAKEIDSRGLSLGLTQPFHQLFLAREPLLPMNVSPEVKQPILLVHGYFSNRGIWWSMRRRLAAAGLGPVYSISLTPPFGSIDRMVPRLDAKIDEILKATGAASLDIVAHSMGGLATRAVLVEEAARAKPDEPRHSRVSHLITLGSPHHGTKMANFGIGECIVEMREGSAWLALLKKREELTTKPKTLSIYTMNDDLVYPAESARLEWAENVPVAGIGHVSMLFSKPIAERVIAALSAR
jgi:triacylglycerol lipase